MNPWLKTLAALPDLSSSPSTKGQANNHPLTPTSMPLLVTEAPGVNIVIYTYLQELVKTFIHAQKKVLPEQAERWAPWLLQKSTGFSLFSVVEPITRISKMLQLLYSSCTSQRHHEPCRFSGRSQLSGPAISALVNPPHFPPRDYRDPTVPPTSSALPGPGQLVLLGPVMQLPTRQPQPDLYNSDSQPS